VNYGDYQDEIYANGLTGVLPGLPISFSALQEEGQRAMSPQISSYVAAGAGDEHTQRANTAAFAQWGLIPRMLTGATHRDLSVTLWGHRWSAPIFLCPIGVIGLCAQDGHGDKAAAQASARTGVPMFASTMSVDPMEQVREITGDTPAFFQLYTPKDRELAESLVHRADSAGFAGIIVTLDTWVPGWRPRDLQHANFPFLRGHCLANYITDPIFGRKSGVDPATMARDPRSVAEYWSSVFARSLGWDDLAWLRSLTSLPLILKGICHPEDARRAVDAGVDGIYCSNHGGRQANGGLPAIECLPEVVAASGDVPVLFDSGVRTGADIVKAIALGASAVGIGRPYAYAMALGGAEGVVHVLRSLLAEADLIMAIDGYQALADLTPETLRGTGRFTA
jgi:lactate 2-monooxygenase